MATQPDPPPGPPPPPGWQRVGPSGRFYEIALPMSHEAIRLNGELRYVFYAEFDTDGESAAWLEFLHDPLKMLKNENVTLPKVGGHLGIRVMKLEADGQEPDDAYTNAITARNQVTIGLLGDWTLDQEDRNRRVTTTIVNHEVPLNPRIGLAY